MTGHMYIFNNTVFQKENSGEDGLGGSGRIIKHCSTRNNILHVREGAPLGIALNKHHEDDDFDHDLISAGFPDGHEKHGIQGKPDYVEGAGFDRGGRRADFQLAPGSPGVGAGPVIPNFCERADGKLPDIGAHESGTEEMRFGVKARFNPPGQP